VRDASGQREALTVWLALDHSDGQLLGVASGQRSSAAATAGFLAGRAVPCGSTPRYR